MAGVDLEVAEGALTALIGRSGSGKITLLRLISGFEAADRGVTQMDGRDVSGLAPHRLRHAGRHSLSASECGR
nr:ATP-binding cassette domain-containing protein [Kineosporia mesophila]